MHDRARVDHYERRPTSRGFELAIQRNAGEVRDLSDEEDASEILARARRRIEKASSGTTAGSGRGARPANEPARVSGLHRHRLRA